ncbi:MAG: tetratricopeptide repeat protein [bacterium]
MSIRSTLRIVMFAAVSLGFIATANADKAAELAQKTAEARSAFRAGKCAEAIRVYREVIALKYHPMYLFRIGQCQQFLKRYQGALKSFERYLKDLPSYACNGCPTKGQTQKRIIDVKTKLASARQRLVDLRSYALRYFRLGKCDDAIRIYREIMAIEYHPIQVYRIGQCYEYKREWRSAISSYTAYVRDISKFPTATGQPTKADAKQRIARLQRKVGGWTPVARPRAAPQPVPPEAQVDADIAKAAMGRNVALTLSDGRTVTGQISGVSSTAVVLVKADGLLVKFLLTHIRGLRVLLAATAPQPASPPTTGGGADAPPVGGGGAPPPIGGTPAYGRYGVSSGYLGGGQPVNNAKLTETQENYWAAKRLRGAGAALTITGLVLELIGGSMFAIQECDGYYGYCSMPDGAFIAGVTMCAIGGLLEMIGIPMWIVGAVKTRVYWDQMQKINAGQPVGGLQVPPAFPHLANRPSGAGFKLGYTFRY